MVCRGLKESSGSGHILEFGETSPGERGGLSEGFGRRLPGSIDRYQVRPDGMLYKTFRVVIPDEF